jgi:nicotinic acid mononucleotide adenylyltransferase
MNPPTPGHLYVIRKLIEKANMHDVDHVYVILSKMNEDKKNPITCQLKKQVLGEGDYEATIGVSKKMINSLKTKMIKEITKSKQTDKEKTIAQIKNITVHLICVPEGTKETQFGQIYPIIKKLKETCAGGINIIVIVGQDREELMHSISKFYYKMDDVHSVDGHAFSRTETEKDASPENKEIISKINEIKPEMSGSHIRKLVLQKNVAAFKEVYSPYLDELNIANLYAKIKEGIGSKPSPKKETTSTKKKPSPPPFPHVKGGRKRKITRKRIFDKIFR